MTPPIDVAHRLLALAQRDMTSFRALATHPEVDISATGFFAQQVVKNASGRYEETPFISMSLEDMNRLVDLAYQWASTVIAK